MLLRVFHEQSKRMQIEMFSLKYKQKENRDYYDLMHNMTSPQLA